MTTQDFSLPAYTQFLDTGKRLMDIVIAGTKGAKGDAGWGVFRCKSAEHRLAIMKAYPAARMPCWTRIEKGEV